MASEAMDQEAIDWFAQTDVPRSDVPYTRDISIVQIPAGVSRCFPKSKRLRKKLAKRHHIRHYRDVSKVRRWMVHEAYPTRITLGPPASAVVRGV